MREGERERENVHHVIACSIRMSVNFRIFIVYRSVIFRIFMEHRSVIFWIFIGHVSNLKAVCSMHKQCHAG